MKLIRGRLAGVSVQASFAAGMWVGFTLGLVVGSVLGALLAWFAGTMLGWQRDLAFTLGVSRSLLPLGDQVGLLRWLSTNWYVVIPAAGVVVALIAGLVGGLIGALLAAAYNQSPRHASVVVELPDGADELAGPGESHAGASAPPTRARGRRRRSAGGGSDGAP